MQLNFEVISTDKLPAFNSGDIEVSVLRLDKIHPVVAGNKWFKLCIYIKEAIEQNKKRIVTFGGAWSNHIVATAAACHYQGLASTGLIRGEQPAVLSDTLLQAKEFGMEIYFLSREDYREKKIPPALQHRGNYIIPEGGFGPNGAKGAGSILAYCDQPFTHYCCAVGTGTMMAGIIQSVTDEEKVLGISVLKNNHALEKNVASLLDAMPKTWEINHDYHFGGYAKYNPALIDFMNRFYSQTGVPSDFVYTGKLFYAVSDLIDKGQFPPGSSLLLIHSGGLQGNSSLQKGTLIY